MLFNTVQFAVYLIALFLLHFSLPHKYRIYLLFVASYYFYMCWEWQYAGLIMFTTAVNYLAAIVIDRSKNSWVRGSVLTVALVVSFGLLFYYKYLNFSIRTINDVSQWLGHPTSWALYNLILPAGISFFTFQSLSYTIDVFLKQLPAETNFIKFATYIAFFPQLVAGPIERASNLLPQMTAVQRIEFENVRAGLQMTLWGLFKKCVIADLLSVVVNKVYASPQDFSGPMLAIATLFFAVQIYCDFSGYSDMALGTARLFGFKLMVNFRQPYLARTISDFWQRWHISLTTWFRDYVYIPLGGNRVSLARWTFNVFAVFLLSGIWHGANWTFVIWGALHGTYFLAQRVVSGPYSRIVNGWKLYRIPLLLPLLEWGVTMLLVLIGWVFFRAPTTAGAIDIIVRSFDWSGFETGQLFNAGLPRFEMALAFVWIIVLMIVDSLIAAKPRWFMTLWAYRPVRWGIYLAGCYAVVFFGVFEHVDFIYFQF
jgi:D-alanyl-lipoteichoic acid acyltransferase DltB (MBOAT superfamily)